MKLTPTGEFIARHSVIVPSEIWLEILSLAKNYLDEADSGGSEDAWQILLSELSNGCQELLKDDKFLEIVTVEEGQQ